MCWDVQDPPHFLADLPRPPTSEVKVKRKRGRPKKENKDKKEKPKKRRRAIKTEPGEDEPADGEPNELEKSNDENAEEGEKTNDDETPNRDGKTAEDDQAAEGEKAKEGEREGNQGEANGGEPNEIDAPLQAVSKSDYLENEHSYADCEKLPPGMEFHRWTYADGTQTLTLCPFCEFIHGDARLVALHVKSHIPGKIHGILKS